MTDSSTYAPAIPGGRPAMPSDWAELVDEWLTPNGVGGWIPDGSEIVIENEQITWPRWRHRNPDASPWEKDVMIAADLWKDGDGHDVDSPEASEPIVDLVTVPLRVLVTDRVRELFDRSTLTLVER